MTLQLGHESARDQFILDCRQPCGAFRMIGAAFMQEAIGMRYKSGMHKRSQAVEGPGLTPRAHP